MSDCFWLSVAVSANAVALLLLSWKVEKLLLKSST